MKNPLNRRLTRELKGELGKYLVILILLIATIGFVSGFLVADGSMLTAYNESFEKYNIEDGHFTVVKQMNKAQKKNIEALGVTLYDLFYVEETLVTNDSTLRIFPDRKDVDKVCLMEGSMPEKSDEIAIDRMYADNNSLKVGDVIASTDHSWRVTDWWHCLITAHYSRTIMIQCLMRSSLGWPLWLRRALHSWISLK